MKPVEGGLSLSVVDGESRYVVFAKDQPQYDPLPALLFTDGKIVTEWALTEDERERIANGENVRLWVWTFGQPLQPVALQVTEQE